MKLSFLINLVAVIAVNVVVALFFWGMRVLGLPMDAQTIVTNITAILPIEIMILVGVDMGHKIRDRTRMRRINRMPAVEKDLWLKEHFDDRTLADRLSLAYYVGVLFILIAAASWYWASIMPTWLEASRALRVCGFFSLLGFFWMFWVYKPSVQTAAEEAVEDWDKGRKKLKKAKTVQDGLYVLGYHLRVNFHGDSITSNLDFSRPLAPYKGHNYTYIELAKLSKKKNASDEIKKLMSSVEPKLMAYVDQLGLVEEIPCVETEPVEVD